MTWNVTGGGDADAVQRPVEDSETSFLVNMCSVVERLVEQERRVLRLIGHDVPSAAVASHYVNVLVANAALRTHAAVHRLVESRVRPGHAADRPLADCKSAVSQLSGDPTSDLRALAEVTNCNHTVAKQEI